MSIASSAFSGIVAAFFPTLSLLKTIADSFARGMRSIGRWADIGTIPFIGVAWNFCHSWYKDPRILQYIDTLKSSWQQYLSGFGDLSSAVSGLSEVFRFVSYCLSLDLGFRLLVNVCIPVYIGIKIWTLVKGWIFRIAPGFSP